MVKKLFFFYQELNGEKNGGEGRKQHSVDCWRGFMFCLFFLYGWAVVYRKIVHAHDDARQEKEKAALHR